MRNVTAEDLIELFGEVIDLSGIKMDTNAVLGDDIPIDSKEMLRILSRIESKYRFRFKPGDILNFKTLGDILEVVRVWGNTRK